MRLIEQAVDDASTIHGYMIDTTDYIPSYLVRRVEGLLNLLIQIAEEKPDE